MKSPIVLIVLIVTFYHTPVTALAVPHPHPEESKIDIAIKLAAANVPPENDNPVHLNKHPWHLKKYDVGDRRDGEHPAERDGYVYSIANPVEQGSPRKRTENWVYYEYDDTGDFLGKREHPYASRIGDSDSPGITNEHLWHSKVPGNVANKRDEENLLGGEDYYNQPEEDISWRNQDPDEGIDADYRYWEKRIPPGSDGMPHLNECLWKSKKGENCVERSDEKFRNGGDENRWGFKEDEERDGETDSRYIPKRVGGLYDDGEEEYLRKIYEGFHYDEGSRYLSKRGSCCLSGERGAVVGQADCDYSDLGMDENEDSCSGDFEVVDYPDHDFVDAMEYLREADENEDEYNPIIGRVRKSPARHHPRSEYPNELLADNGYLCETTENSPTAVDVVEIANKFKYQKGTERCAAGNALGSKCTKLDRLGSAQIAICSIHTGWFVYRENVGEHVLELSRRCKSDINGVWRVGGTIFHESGKGSLIVF